MSMSEVNASLCGVAQGTINKHFKLIDSQQCFPTSRFGALEDHNHENLYILLDFLCHSAQRVAILSQKMKFLSQHACVNQSQLEELVKVRPRSREEIGHLQSGFQQRCSVFSTKDSSLGLTGLFWSKLIHYHYFKRPVFFRTYNNLKKKIFNSLNRQAQKHRAEEGTEPTACCHLKIITSVFPIIMGNNRTLSPPEKKLFSFHLYH